MDFFRARPAYPKDRDLVRVVRAAACRLVEKLEDLDTDPLDLSAAARTLFERHRDDLRAYIESRAHVFAWSLPRDEKPFSELSLVAFNDGIGICSLLAKECSIGTVVYHDSDDILRCDAQLIARTVGQPADHYVFGDTEEVDFIARRHGLACDVFVSSDDAAGSRAERAAARDLVPFLNSLSQSSMGALSVGLAVEGSSSGRSPSGVAAAEIDSLSRTLDLAGFEVSVVRGPVTIPLGSAARRTILAPPNSQTEGREPRLDLPSTRFFVLAGSRSAGTHVPEATPAASAKRTLKPAPVRVDPDSRELHVR